MGQYSEYLRHNQARNQDFGGGALNQILNFFVQNMFYSGGVLSILVQLKRTTDGGL